MSTTIRIKRSSITAVPNTLASGELAYSWENTAAGKLYIGFGDEVTPGVAPSIAAIGGKYYTDLVTARISHTPGTLTANSAIIVDSNSKIDQLFIDDIHINGSTISTAVANTNITLTPGGNKNISVSSARITSLATPVDDTDAVNKSYVDDLTDTAIGNLQANTSLEVSGDSGSTSIFLATEIFNILGGTGLSSAVTDDTVTINLDNTTVVAAAYDTTTGVPTFTVDAQGRLTAAGNSATLSGMTSIAVGNITLSSNEISVANTLVIDTTGGLIDVSGAKITAVGTPTANTDAANKQYVDTAVESLNASSNMDIDGDTGSISIILASEIFTISGGTGLSTAAANNSLIVNLDDTGVVAGTYGSATEIPIFEINAQGQVVSANTASVASSLAIAGDGATSDTVNLLDDTLTFAGGTGITTTVTNNQVSIAGDDATSSTKGIASFNSTNFTVTNGAVAANDLTIGTTAFTIGETVTDLAGLTSIEIDNININGNTISTTDTNGDLILSPNGSGAVSVASSKITNLAAPTVNTDAATKEYVDTIASASLHYHDPVRVESPVNLDAAYSNGTAGVGATLTSNSNGAIVIDGVSLVLADRVLIYEQTNPAHNGIYTVTTVGDGSTPWVLTRATDSDSYAPSDPAALGLGDAFFVKEGNTGAGELYVMTTEGTITFGTTAITFSQIAASQIYIAGDALSLDGVTFNVNVDDSSIEINADALRVKAAGITNAMLAGSIENSKLVNSSITFAAETGTSDPVSLGETVTFAAGEGINTAVSNNTITISGEDASDTNKGIARFDITDFTVTSGNVTVNAERIQDIVFNAIVDGEGIDISYNDSANTFIISGEDATLTNKGIASFGGYADDGNTVRQFSVTSGDVKVVSLDGGSF